MRRSLAILMALASWTILVLPARAGIVNGELETWHINPSSGIYEPEGWTASAGHSFDGGVLRSGGHDSDSGVLFHARADTTSPGIMVQDGWSLSQTFSATAGQSVALDYRVTGISLETPPSGGAADAWFYAMLWGGDYLEQWLDVRASSDWTTFSFPSFSTTGVYTIDLGVRASADAFPVWPPSPVHAGASIYAQADNVRLESVPEPSAIITWSFLAVCGLVATLASRKRRAARWVANAAGAGPSGGSCHGL